MAKSIVNQPKPKGGKRPGAGRKPKRISTIVKKLPKTTAAMILSEINEQSIWMDLLEKGNDPRIRLDALKYLTDKRDGKAKQMVEASGPDGAPLALAVGFVDSE